MNRFLSLDSPIMRGLSRLADLMMLNFYFLVTCIPIFTIGAALTAMYTVTFRFNTEREEGVTRSYFRAFRENFRQATGLWLLALLCMGLSFFDALFFYTRPGALRFLTVIFGLLFVVAAMVSAYAFPLLSQFENTTKGTIRNAFLMSVGFLPRTLVICVLNLLPFGLLLMDLILFFQVGFVWFVLYFASAAYVNTILLRKIFAPYMEKAQEEEE